jgi:hypothetical protein
MGGRKESVGNQEVRRSRSGHRILRPHLQHGDAESVEDEKETPPPVGELPEEDPDPDRAQDLIAAGVGHRVEKGGERRRVPSLQGLVYQLIPRHEVVARGRERQAHKKKETEEYKQEATRHPGETMAPERKRAHATIGGHNLRLSLLTLRPEPRAAVQIQS